MPFTRAMEEQLRQLMATVVEMKKGQDEMKEEMKKGQDEMKEEMKKGQDEMTEEMKKGQEEMKEEMKEMKKSQDEIKDSIEKVQENVKEEMKEMKKSQDEIKDSMEKVQENVKEEMKEVKKSQEEMKNVLEERFSSVEKRVDEVEGKMEKRFDEVRESTDTAIREAKESTDAAIADVRESTAGEINQLKNEMENIVGRLQRMEQGEPIKEEVSSNVHLPVKELSESDAASIPGIIPSSSIKTSIYDGKTAWNVYKTQFDLIASANGWDDRTKAYHLAASLRGEAADVLQTVPENRRADWATLISAIELRFGEQHLKDYSRVQLKTRKQKSGETLQELASDIERLSLMAFPDCPSDVRDNLALEYFVDAIRDSDVQEAVRISGDKDLKSALVFAMKVEAAHQASRRERRPVRAAMVRDPSKDLKKRLEKIERLITSMTQGSADQKYETKLLAGTARKKDTSEETVPREMELPLESGS